MRVNPSPRRQIASPDPVTSPRASSSHEAQLDLRLNSITGRSVVAKAKLPGNETDGSNRLTDNELDALAKTFGELIASALRYSAMTQKDTSFRMGYADASKLARWISGEDVSSFVARLFSLSDFQRGFLIALAEHARVKVRTVVEIDHEAAV